MPRDNTVWVRGRLASDPHFEILDGRTPHCRFQLVVLRDPSQQGHSTPSPAAHAKARAVHIDLLRVVIYGERAGLDFFYLCKGGEVALSGWAESRRYLDKRSGRWRMIQEINAQTITFGPGCNFARGDAQRQRKLEEARDSGRTNLEALGLSPLDALPEHPDVELED